MKFKVAHLSERNIGFRNSCLVHYYYKLDKAAPHLLPEIFDAVDFMARNKFNKPGGARKPGHKRKAAEAELEENGDASKRPAGLEDILQNSSNDVSGPDALVTSKDPLHPANHICTLCRKFYDHGWVTGTGGGVSIRDGKHIFIAPSGVQKELMKPTDMFVMDVESQAYLRRPAVSKQL